MSEEGKKVKECIKEYRKIQYSSVFEEIQEKKELKSVKVDVATSFVIKDQVESLSDTDDNGPKEGSVVEFRLNVCIRNTLKPKY